MRKNTLALFIATAGLVAFSATPAWAVETSCDGLQDALTNSDPGETITVVDDEPCFGTWTLPSYTIILEGGHPDRGQVLDGEGNGPILRGHDVDQTTIRNLTLRNGNATPSGDENPDNNGGAIYLTGGSHPTIENNLFHDNNAASGGAVAIEPSGPFVVERGGESLRVRIIDNFFIDPGDGQGEDGNTAVDRGGALYVDYSGPVDITGNTFDGNAVLGSGGGVYAIAGQLLTMADNSFLDNFATQRGGGASARLCDEAEITGNEFTQNTIDDLVINGELGRASRDRPLGAGLHLDRIFCQGSRGIDEVPVVDQSGNTFTENLILDRQDGRFPGAGGGEGARGLSINSLNDRFFGNAVEMSGGEGGGLFVDGSRIVLEGRNLVAADNEVDGNGGGVAIRPNGFGNQLLLFDSTVVANDAIAGAGLLGGDCDELVLHNSIVHGNTNSDGDEIEGFDSCKARGEVSFGTRDVQYTDTCAPGDSGVTAHEGEGNICADPLLVNPVAPAYDVHQTSSSPTLDRGLNDLVPPGLTGDFEGQARISDGNGDGSSVVDMGADEFIVPPPNQPSPVQPAAGCLNSQGGVSGRRLGPVLLGRRRAAQREVMLGAQLLTRFGMDKYCVTGGGLFRIGYPTARINRTIGRSLRRAVADRVVIALTSSPRFNVSGIVPSQTSGSTARQRLRGERRFQIGRNTWLVAGAPRPVGRAQSGVMRLVKIQRGRVREVGIGDRRLARGDRKQLKRYLKTWQALGF